MLRGYLPGYCIHGRRIASVSALLVVAMVFSESAAAQDRSFEVNAYATATTDYRFRGISQSDGSPALQLGVDIQHDSGLFLGIWTSTIDFDDEATRSNPRDLEIDLYVGYSRQWSRDWSSTFSVVRYAYPDTSFDYDYSELLAGIRYRDRIGLTVAYSNRVLGHDAAATDYEVDFAHPLGDRFSFSAVAGYYDLDQAFGTGYSYWNLGVSRDFGRFALDARYYDDSGTARQLFGDGAADDALVFSVTFLFL